MDVNNSDSRDSEESKEYGGENLHCFTEMRKMILETGGKEILVM